MSYYGCDLCFARSLRFVENETTLDEISAAGGIRGRGRNRAKVDKRTRPKGATHVYPAGTRGELRTHDRHLELAARAGTTRKEDLKNDFYGVYEGTPFVTTSVPNLDIISDIPIDWRADSTYAFSSLVVRYLTLPLHVGEAD